MQVFHRDDVDIVKELRLRRWAREHHVCAEKRRSSWHPVVLDEMCRKDDELLIRSRSRGPVSSFVPLVPTAIQRVHPRREQAPAALVAPEGQARLQRSDRPHDSVVSHVSTATTAGNAIGSLQVTTISGE